MSQLCALVIDDNPQNLKVLSQFLSKQGIQCIEVLYSIRLAELLPKLSQVDLVFLDLEMPGLDGYGAKDLLRARLGDVPIIAYTVHVSEMTVVKEKGFDGFLGKPLDNQRFPQHLARILAGESVWERLS